MIRPIFSAFGANTNASGNRWISFDTGAGVAFNGTEANMRIPVSINATVGDAPITTGVLAVGGSYIFTLYKNGSATAQTVTIANPATSGTATGGIVTVAPGDTLSWSALPQGGVAATGATIGTSLIGTSAGETSIGAATNLAFGTGATAYYSLFGVDAVATDALASIPFPVAGVLDKLYVETSVVPGTAKSYQVTLYKNGIATGLTATVSGNTLATANDPTNTVTVTANDTLSVEVIPSGTPTAAFGKWSVRLTPTTDGQSPIMVRVSPPTATANRFYSFNGKSNAGSGSLDAPAPVAFALSNLYTTVDVAPGGTAAYTTFLRQAGAATALSVTIPAAGTPGSDITHTINIAANDAIGWANNRTSTPAASNKQTVSALAYIAPVTGGFTPIPDMRLAFL